MYLFVFQEKLKKLNPHLYVDTSASTPVVGSEWRVASIRLRKGQAASKKSLTGVLDQGAARFLEALEAGQVDEVVGGVPVDWVPEYDLLDKWAERPRLLARGWRSVALGLVKRGLTTREKAQRAFSASLGEYAYDHLTLEQKWQRECPEMVRRVSRDLSDLEGRG